MRIVIFTVNDMQFVPTLLEPLLKERPQDIVRVYVSSFFPPDWDFLKKKALFFAKNGYPFCIRPGDWVRYLKDRFRMSSELKSRPKDIFEYLKDLEIPTEKIKEIKSAQKRSELKSLEPDLFLFAPFDKIAGPKFLSIPRLGTYNVHLGKLPEYQGGLSAFWVLRFGDETAGASIHRATPQLDKGDLVEEIRIPVQTKSMRELMLHTVQETGLGLCRAVSKIEAGNWAPVNTENRKEAYHYLPTWSDFSTFYRLGCRLI